MKKRVLAFLCVCVLAAGAVAGCGSQTGAAGQAGSEQTTPQTTPEVSGEHGGQTTPEVSGEPEAADEQTTPEVAEVAGIDTSVMKPWINANIYGLVTDDVTADIKDDFYLAVNHDWLRDAELYPGRPSATPWYQAVDTMKERCMTILADESLKELEGPEGHDAELIQNYYYQFLDWESRNEAGLAPVMPAVEALQSVKTLDDLRSFLLSDTYARFSTQDAPALVPIGLDKYTQDSGLYQVNLGPTNLLLEDAAEYRKITENGKRVKKQKESLASYMLERVGLTKEEAQKAIDNVNELDARLAEYVTPLVETQDPSYLQGTVNPVTMDQIREMTPNYPLAEIMERDGWSEAERINVLQPGALKELDALFTEENAEALRDKILVNILLGSMQYLDEAAYREYIKQYMEFYGLTQVPADETRAYTSTRGMFRDSFGRLYVRQYLDESVREEIRQICEDVIDTYREMLAKTDWLSAETREAAQNKLDAIAIHAVYPDKWEDYSIYSVNEDGDILTARLDRAAADKQRDVGRMNGSVDKELWGDIDIIETNAYYEPKDNSINIIPGFFCDVTYRSDMSIEEKYGALGGVIGHEISHAFDSGGAQYDAAGNFNNWWTPEDKAAFDERTGKVIAYFDKIVPFDDGTPNSGKLVNTEATADMGGIKCVLLMAEKIDGFDYDKFFRAYARMWQRMDTLQMCEWLATSDSHPLSYQRINVTLQQFDEFLDTYGIKEGDGMYLAPEDRILIW